ncbi:MAG TPA: deoxynucleoside kinase [Ignavibacteria bacterium]|nr:deoxynucleoside kinase [Ignavibacteria bacterium]HQY52017.1 deoxynucleoside kinase [Ignavibacteria bacterium]
MNPKKKSFVSVAGNIGSGKSSLTSLIAGEFDWKPFYEKVNNNPYLKDFYSDMNRWSFNLQVYFLSHRFKTHVEILKSRKSVIQDRSIYEDVEIFALNLYKMGKMSKRDHDNYRQLFKEMTSFLKAPDLLLYLQSDLPKLQKQIHLRGRDFEKNIDPEYLKKLNESYNEWISNYKSGRCVIVDSNDMDFVNRKGDLKKITELIKKSI